MKTAAYTEQNPTKPPQSVTIARMPITSLIVIWTILIVALIGYEIKESRDSEYATALTVAQSNYNKDILYRRWALMHDGIYVPVKPDTLPSPILAGIPDRDVRLPSGKMLTLINPAYMTRQVHELEVGIKGVRGHLTSATPIREQNVADKWEQAALRLFEKGTREHSSLETIDGVQFFRFMRPMITENECLACHARQGHKTGDIRGGLSISIPWAPYKEHLLANYRATTAGLGGIWLVGLAGIIFSGRRIEKSLKAKEKLYEELSRSNERYKQLTEVFPETIFEASANGIVTYTNQHGLDTFRYSKAEFMNGVNIFSLVAPEYHQIVRERIGNRLRGIDVGHGYLEYKALRSDGSTFDAMGLTVPLFVQGVATGYRGFILDISESKENEAKLRSAMIAAEAANSAKGEFLATISHEIRTPLYAVIGMTDLLLETALNDEQHEYVEIIRTRGNHLHGLINDILDFSSIEARHLYMDTKDFNLQASLQEIAELMAVKATDANLKLAYRIDPDVPVSLRGDPLRLTQVITNMVDNALKFTLAGEVDIHVSLEWDQEDRVSILFEIHDTGIGIAQSRFDDIFSPFTQLDSTPTRKYGGTGLGLAICKRLVKLMGGDVGVVSEEGKGSTFWFSAQFEKQEEHVGTVSRAFRPA